MRRTKQLLGAVSSVALVALSTAPAYAAGTTAGDAITNTVSVDYQVGGVDQTTETATDTFTVDRKVDVVVSETGTIGRTGVSPNETQAVIQFNVQNLSNDVVDLDLSAAVAAGNDFALSNIVIYSDANGDGIINGTDAPITYLDEMAEDEIRSIIVVADIPAGATSGQTADIVLTANAFNGGNTGSLGTTELVDTAGANTSGVDTVLADGASTNGTDSANQGDFSWTDGYVVSAADITVAKASTLISDPVNGTTNPKAIPGAVVEYCITVSNASGSATATSVNVSDVLPADVTYLSSFGIFVDGTVDGGGACQADGSSGGSFTTTPNPTVSGSLSDIAAGVTRTLYFRATIN